MMMNMDMDGNGIISKEECHENFMQICWFTPKTRIQDHISYLDRHVLDVLRNMAFDKCQARFDSFWTELEEINGWDQFYDYNSLTMYWDEHGMIEVGIDFPELEDAVMAGYEKYGKLDF